MPQSKKEMRGEKGKGLRTFVIGGRNNLVLTFLRVVIMSEEEAVVKIHHE